MAFEHAERVRFRRTSLKDVICQIRFAPVLRIDIDTPSVFQEAVKALGFVGYERREVASFPIVKMLGGPIPVHPQRVEHVFLNRPKASSIVLAQDFVAVSTNDYKVWEDFRPLIRVAAETTARIYAPAHATRVGLRYVNVIARSALELSNIPWRDLLAPQLLGLLSAHDEIDGISQQIGFAADATNTKGRLAHGLVETDGETAYLLDTDYWREGELSFEEALGSLDDLHTRTADTFHACLGPRLVAAMQPSPLEG